jgi:hypothetical protein
MTERPIVAYLSLKGMPAREIHDDMHKIAPTEISIWASDERGSVLRWFKMRSGREEKSPGASKHSDLFPFLLKTAASWRRPLEYRAVGGPRMFALSQMDDLHFLSINKEKKHFLFRSSALETSHRHATFAMNRFLSEKWPCENYLSYFPLFWSRRDW